MAALFARSRALVQKLSSAASVAQFSTTARAAAATTFKLSDESFKVYKLDSAPSTTVTAEKEEFLNWFKQMNVVRRMETAAGEAYRAKLIRGFLHLYSGQEAVCVGMTAAFGAKDSLITAYRCHGWAYMQGYSVKAVLAELFGRVDGCSMGKGGSMHMYGKQFFGGNGIVGAQVPVGAGVALAHKTLNEDAVCYALYGDGASNQGQVFEAYNIAKLWKLPVVFVCENNKFGMGTSSARSSANTLYYTRGDYIPGIWVDGMNVLAVREATKFARAYARKEGPIVMEMETYRYHGHSMSDPDNTYRTREDIKKVREQFDCILKARSYLLESGLATEDELKQVEKDVRNLVNADLEAARESPIPPDSLFYEHIFTGEKLKNIRGCDSLTSYSQQ